MRKHSIQELSFDEIRSSAFRADYFLPGIPVVLRNAIANWPAMEKWNREYFEELFGDREMPMEFSADGFLTYTAGAAKRNAQRTKMPFREAAREIEGTQKSDQRVCYVRNISIPDDLPELADDAPAPAELVDPKLVTKTQFWYGTAGCVTALHFDWPSNFLAQVSGRKQCLLFSPDDTPNVYPASDQPPGEGDWIDLREHSLVNPDQPDLEKHPKFAAAKQYEAVLHPGDMLWLPPCWWHQIRSLDTSISVNFWWPPRVEQLAFWATGDEKIVAAFDAGVLVAMLQGAFETRIYDGSIGMALACLNVGKPWAAVLVAANAADFELGGGDSSQRAFGAPGAAWRLIRERVVANRMNGSISEEVVAGWEGLVQEARKGNLANLSEPAVREMLIKIRGLLNPPAKAVVGEGELAESI